MVLYGKTKAIPGDENGLKEATMKLTRTKILMTALALALLAAVAVSQTEKWGHMHGDGMAGEHMLSFMTDYLDLTDAQQAQVKDIMAKAKPSMQSFAQQMAQTHVDIAQVVHSGSFDEAKVRSLAAQQSQAMQEMIVQKARIDSQIFQVLTPDQKSKMLKHEAQHEQRMMKHMEEAPPGQ
jgi:Spy/CpxP family protein refolding chaperone